MYGALLVGISRSIPLIMEQSYIIDTIVNWLATMLQNLHGAASAVGMLLVQNIINFFILSGVGQALVTMPILARSEKWSVSAVRSVFLLISSVTDSPISSGRLVYL